MPKSKLLLILTLLSSSLVCADTQQEVIRGFKDALPDDIARPTGIDRSSASFANPEAAAKFIANVIKDNSFEYCIIHLLRWAEKKNDKQDIQAQNWYVFRRGVQGWSQEDFTSRQHLAGAKRVCIAFVHLNIQTADDPQYAIQITKKLPSNVAHMFGLLNAFAGGGSSSQGPKLATTIPPDQWGSSVIDLKYVPSTITVSASQRSTDLALQTALGTSTFDNEGPLYWDISVAVPVKKISQVKIESSSGTPTPLNVSDQAVFGALDVYYPGLDPSRSTLRLIPHPLVGAAFAHRPLHRILVAGGWGPSFSEVYIGGIWATQPVGVGGCGKTPVAGEKTHNRHCPQFTIGINVQLSSVASALKFH